MINSKIPILLIAFRRPKETLKVLREIKKYYPDDLYFFVDASAKDEFLVKEVQNLILIDNYAKIFIKISNKITLVVDWAQ